MNIFYKLYARTFQSIFKIAIPILPYKDPFILENIERVNEVFKETDKP